MSTNLGTEDFGITCNGKVVHKSGTMKKNDFGGGRCFSEAAAAAEAAASAAAAAEAAAEAATEAAEAEAEAEAVAALLRQPSRSF